MLKQNGSCCWCGHVMLGFITIEHIIPRSLGGSNEIENLALSHEWCNKARGSDVTVEPNGRCCFGFIRDRLAQFRAGLIQRESDSFGPQRGIKEDAGEIVGLGQTG